MTEVPRDLGLELTVRLLGVSSDKSKPKNQV